jgi:ribonuclease P protein component
MLKKDNRLTTKFQFNVTKKYGTKDYFDLFTAYYVKPTNYLGPAKVGFIVPNTIHKKAAKRNKIKRILRETVRKQFSKIPDNYWVTLSANQKILGRKYEEINSQVDRFIQKISLAR